MSKIENLISDLCGSDNGATAELGYKLLKEFDDFRHQLEAAQGERDTYKEDLYQLRQKAENWSTKLGFIKNYVDNNVTDASEKEKEFPHLIIDRLQSIIKKAQEQDCIYQIRDEFGSAWIDVAKNWYELRKASGQEHRVVFIHTPIPADHSEEKALSIELDEKQEMKYQSLLENQDWINTDLRKLAIRIAVKLNYSGNGLIDYYPAVLFAEALLPHSGLATKELISGLEKMIKTVKPLSNFEEYQVLAMSPTQMINHINDLLSQSEVKPS